MRGRAPLFAALRVVEAVCRHRSYTLAGQALGITHSAVSQQVKRLEENLGVPLFIRRGLEMEPTPTAQALAATYADASRLVDGAIAAASASPSHLTISMMPSMASLWLAPRLTALRSALPDTALNILTTRELADLEAGEADVAIRFGGGDWPRVNSRLLFRETIFPVASPDFAERHQVAAPADLAHAPLLLPDYPPWSLWFEAAGVPPTDTLKGLRVDDASLALKAAASGLGAVLIRPDLAQADLAAGRLVRLFDIEAVTGVGCYFVWREANAQIAAIRVLLAWFEEAFGVG
jgi:LysR family glycine cleavage system transcriptional activator